MDVSVIIEIISKCDHFQLCFVDFGDEMVQTLVDHYRQQLLEKELDVGLIESEWMVLRNALYNKYVYEFIMFEIY